MKIGEKTPLIFIVSVYVIANIFMLFNDGMYWDDWCLSTPEGIASIYTGIGAPFMMPIHAFLLSITTHPALLYHILTGILELLVCVLFFKCLLQLGVHKSHTFLLTLIFSLLPYNEAKMTLSCFMYTIGLFLFLVAVFLFLVNNRKQNLVKRILSLLLFFCSFGFLPSTLVFSLAFFLLMAVLSLQQKITFNAFYLRQLVHKLISWSDFVLVPFVFWIFRALFLAPTGIYAAENYRGFSVSSVLLTPIKLIESFIQNFIGLGITASPLITNYSYVLLFVGVFMLVFLFSRKYKIEYTSDNKPLLFIGLYLFIAGVFAYLMVGLLPLFDSYNSRHQILLRFGSTFLIFYLINLISSDILKKLIVSTILALFIIFTINYQLQFQKSWFKQMALEKAFKQEKLLSEGVNFLVVDNTADYNEFSYKEPYRFYCYTGILYKAFGTQTRFAIDSKELNLINHSNSGNLINSKFLTKDCKNITSFSYMVIINKGNVLLSDMKSSKLLYLYYFNKEKFDKLLTATLVVKTIPYTIENKRIWNL